MANPGTSEPKRADRRTGERRRNDREHRGAAASDLNFWAVFESAPDAYLLLAPDPPRFTMIAANETRLRVTMTRREDVVGQPLFDVFPDNPTDPAATGVRNLRASLDEVIRTGKPHRMALQKYDIRTPDGAFEARYWDALNAPVFDERGNLIYIIHRVEDVTDQVMERRQAENTALRLTRETAARAEEARARQALRASEERYRLLADLIPQHIWTTDPSGYHGYFSRRWYDFTGATLAQTEGDKWLNFIHPDDRERTVARWQHSLQTGEPYSIEYRFRAVDGEYHWFLGQAMPQRDDAGTIVGWFGTLTDISERKRLDEEREQLLERERHAREQVTTILESITDAFYAVDREWRFTYVNREAERLLKRPRQELLGRSVWEEFSAAVGSTLQHEYRRAVAEQVTVEFETFAPTIGLWVDVRAYPSDDGLSVFFRDVTARKQAEEKLRESERNFRALANSIPQLAWMADASGWIFWYNERWHEYTGTTLAEMEGWGWQKVHHPDHVQHVVARIRHAFETGEPWEDTFPLRSKTGEYRWFLSRALPIRDHTGQVVRWFGTNTDVTEQIDAAAERERLLNREQEARAEAERRREELERVTESRTRLMRGFTHDVKNPLGAADGYAQLLEDGVVGELSAQQVESVQRIRRSLERSLHLINELMELARAEAGQIELEPETVDVTELVRDAAEDFRAQATAAGLALEVRAAEPLPTRTDPTRVRQILGNLLSNAVKYTPAGSITVTADHRPNRGGDRRAGGRRDRRSGGSGDRRSDGSDVRPADCIAVRVSDTGPGIPLEKQELIFQEFTRLDPEAPHGAGVGLAISRRIARLLGGNITVESEVERGSTFTLWLPAAAT